MSAGEAFFVPDGDRYRGTAHTAGPWDPRSNMHFGPPAALLGRAIEATDGGETKRVTRATFEILRPVPIGAVAVRTRVVRSGRRVDLVDAVLTDGDGVELALARAWRMRMADLGELPGSAAPAPPPGPDAGVRRDFFAVDAEVHYGTSVEARFVEGGFTEPGPAVVWMRMRVPLVAGEEPSPLSRVLVAADSGNGVSAVADPVQLLFVNTDLTVSLTRRPVGEWIGLDASTLLDAGGSGVATSRLSDTNGGIGTALQTLFVEPRFRRDIG